MLRPHSLPLVVPFVLVVLLIAACGDGADDSVGTTFASSTTTTTEADPVAETSTTTTATAAGTSICPEGGCEVVEKWNIDYGDRDKDHERLDIYAPVEPGEWPVVVLAHGGRYSRTSMRALARALASRGAVVYAASYLDTAPLEAVEDMSCAIRYASSTAADYGGHPDRIVVVGHSLGATIGFLASASGEDHTPSWCLAPDAWVEVTGFVGYEGPYDIAYQARMNDVTGLEQSDPDAWHSVNPYSQIGRNDGLIIRLIHGIDAAQAWYDLPPEISEDFEQSLSEAGYDVELITVDGANHGGCINRGPGFDEVVNATMELVGA